jgi:hypothetical protein
MLISISAWGGGDDGMRASDESIVLFFVQREELVRIECPLVRIEC